MKKSLLIVFLLLIALILLYLGWNNTSKSGLGVQDPLIINTGTVLNQQTGSINTTGGVALSGENQQNTGTQGTKTGDSLPSNGDDTVLPLDPENGGDAQNASGAITADPEVDEIVNLLEELIAESEGGSN